MSAVLLGCGAPGPVPVRGSVTFEGKPLADASVQFVAQDPGGRDAFGYTTAEGYFRLTTFRPDDGALPGLYKVVVQRAAEVQTTVVAKSPEEAQRAAVQAPARMKAPAVVLPPQYTDPARTILKQEVPPRGDVVFDLRREVR